MYHNSLQTLRLDSALLLGCKARLVPFARLSSALRHFCRFEKSQTTHEWCRMERDTRCSRYPLAPSTSIQRMPRARSEFREDKWVNGFENCLKSGFNWNTCVDMQWESNPYIFQVDRNAATTESNEGVAAMQWRVRVKRSPTHWAKTRSQWKSSLCNASESCLAYHAPRK